MITSLRAVPILAVALTLSACSDARAPENSTPADTPERATEALVPAEREITAGALAGTHLDAGADTPVVLIVPGSGPTDRDGNSPMGVSTASYAKLAAGLAERGVSSVRVDKRGMFGSSEAGDPNAVSVDIYAADYRSWIDTIRAETGADCVFLAGHSEGGLMVSAAAQGRDDVCGVIYLAAPGRTGFDILREQLRANPANRPILGEALGYIDQLERGEGVDVADAHPALKGLFAPQVQDFMMDAFAADPAAMAGALDVPVLVVQGEHDIQVSMDDAQALQAATGGRLVRVPGVNHVLVEAPGDRMRNMMTYRDPNAPISPAVVDAVAAFVRGTP